MPRALPFDVLHHFGPAVFWCHWIASMRYRIGDDGEVRDRLNHLVDQFEAMGDWMVWEIEHVAREHHKKYHGETKVTKHG